MTVISVSGASERKVAPELVVLELKLEQEGQSRQECLEAVSRLQHDLIELFQSRQDEGAISEFSAQSIRSGSYDKWVGGNHPNVLTEYARSSISVTYRDFAVLGQDIARIGTEPLLSLSSNQWKLSDTSRKALEHELRAEAVANAKQRAEIYAEAADLSLDSVLQINEPGVEPPASSAKMARSFAVGALAEAMPMGAADDSSSGFDLVPALLEYAVKVHVHYSAVPAVLS